MAAAAMALLLIASQTVPGRMVGVFTSEPGALATGEEYLRIVSWSFVASGIIFVASSMFQALGNTLPSLVSSLARVTITAIPVLLLAQAPGFQLWWVWAVSTVTVWLQLVMAMLLLRREFRRRLAFTALPVPV
jgi:Na+-driven multidrug efflux pump